MKTINEHIEKQQFKPVYLLYGEERYLVTQFRDKLRNALLGDGDKMNVSVYEGNSINVKEVIDMAETLPFFAERKIIIIEDSGMLKNSNDVMADYIKNIPDTTVFLFVEEEVDKRNRLYKAIKDKGYVCELNFQNENVLKRWIKGQLAPYGVSIDDGASELLLEKSGVSMTRISTELLKLVSYVGDRKNVTREDVSEIVTTVVTNRIFDMITAMAAKRQKEAMDMYYDLLSLKEPPMRILFLIARHFNLLMQIKEMSVKYVDEATMSKTAGLPSFLVGKYKAQSRSFSKEQLLSAVRTCVEVEERVKTGRLEDRLGVELIIVKYSS